MRYTKYVKETMFLRNTMPSAATKSEKAIFRTMVKVKVTR